MKIFSIVVLPSSKNSFSASLGANFLVVDPIEKLIRATLAENNGAYVDFLYENIGTHSMSMPGAAFYARCTGNKIIVAALDQAIKPTDLHKLMNNIDAAATSNDLTFIIDNPEESLKDKTDIKINTIKKDLEETKQVMLRNIDKVIERGDKIAILVEKTEALEKQAFLFNKSTLKLKESMRCPGMWSLFTPIINATTYVSSRVFGENEVKYEYEPSEPDSPVSGNVIKCQK